MSEELTASPESLGRELLLRVLTQEREHALILLDSEGRVVSWLAAAERTLGYTAREMRGATLERIFTPEDLARGDLDWELRAARSYGKAEDDRWQVRKDGVRIWVSGVTTALHDDQGALIGFCKMLRDRTDLRSHLETLQSRLDQSSHSETERYLLLGTLAHELRNPLDPLSNAAHVIRMVAGDKPQIATSLQIIERQVRFIENLVRDLLEATRAGVGKTECAYQTIELAEVVDKAVETCSVMLGDRQQKVEVLLPAQLNLDADPVRLQQVLVNIISNSSKFSPPGSRIWVKGTVDGEQLVLRVEDQGKGIPAPLLPRIFEFFTQAEEGARADHGLGLGLGLVKRLVELHGGTVQARSEGNDKGTEIIIRLPLRRPGPQPFSE